MRSGLLSLDQIENVQKGGYYTLLISDKESSKGRPDLAIPRSARESSEEKLGPAIPSSDREDTQRRLGPVEGMSNLHSCHLTSFT